MKNTTSKFSFLFFLLTIGLFFSCGKDDANDPTPNEIASDDNYFTCQMEDQNFERKGFYAYATDWDDTEVYTVYGSGKTNSTALDSITIYIEFPQSLEEGEHEFNDETFALVGDYAGDVGYTTFNFDGFGRMKLTSKTENRLEGTFSFTAVDFNISAKKVEVNSGEFSVEIR